MLILLLLLLLIAGSLGMRSSERKVAVRVHWATVHNGRDFVNTVTEEEATVQARNLGFTVGHKSAIEVDCSRRHAGWLAGCCVVLVFCGRGVHPQKCRMLLLEKRLLRTEQYFHWISHHNGQNVCM